MPKKKKAAAQVICAGLETRELDPNKFVGTILMYSKEKGDAGNAVLGTVIASGRMRNEDTKEELGVFLKISMTRGSPKVIEFTSQFVGDVECPVFVLAHNGTPKIICLVPPGHNKELAAAKTPSKPGITYTYCSMGPVIFGPDPPAAAGVAAPAAAAPEAAAGAGAGAGASK